MCSRDIWTLKLPELTHVYSTLFVKREKRLPTQTIRGVHMHFRPVAFLLGNVHGQSIEVLIFELHSRRDLSTVRSWVLVNEQATWSVSYYWFAASKLVPRRSRSSPQFLRKREAARSLRYVPLQSSADQQYYRKSSGKLAE